MVYSKQYIFPDHRLISLIQLASLSIILCMMLLEGCLKCPDWIASTADDGDSEAKPSRYSMDCFGEMTLDDVVQQDMNEGADGNESECFKSPSGLCKVVCSYRDGFAVCVDVIFPSNPIAHLKEKCYRLESLNGCRGILPIWYDTNAGEMLVVYAQLDTHNDCLFVFRPSHQERALTLLYFSPIKGENRINHLYIDADSIHLSRDCVLEYSIYCSSQDAISERRYHIRVPMVCLPEKVADKS